MDITRLPSAPYARPVTTSSGTTTRANATGVVAPVEVVNEGRAFGNERPTRVLQGELLDRQRDSYQSTRAFVDERNLDQSRPADQSGAPAPKSRAAILQYANNIRSESIADLTQGRSVNFFV